MEGKRRRGVEEAGGGSCTLDFLKVCGSNDDNPELLLRRLDRHEDALRVYFTLTYKVLL